MMRMMAQLLHPSIKFLAFCPVCKSSLHRNILHFLCKEVHRSTNPLTRERSWEHGHCNQKDLIASSPRSSKDIRRRKSRASSSHIAPDIHVALDSEVLLPKKKNHKGEGGRNSAATPCLLFRLASLALLFQFWMASRGSWRRRRRRGLGPGPGNGPGSEGAGWSGREREEGEAKEG